MSKKELPVQDTEVTQVTPTPDVQAQPAKAEKPAKPVKPSKPAKPVKAEKPAKPKKHKNVSLESKKARQGWLFVLPFVVGLITMFIPIVYDSLVYCFTKIELNATGFTRTFVGWGNLVELMEKDVTFFPALESNLLSIAYNLPLVIFFSLFMAVMLNQKMAGRTLFRAIFFLPVILATGIIDKVDYVSTIGSLLNNATTGSIDIGTSGAQATGVDAIVEAMNIQAMFSNMAFGADIANYVMGAAANILSVVNMSGVQMLIFLAGLQSIHPSIYEAAYVEGATGWETFWKITLPMISPMIFVNIIYTIIDNFTNSSNGVMTQITQAFSSQSYGLASVMAWIYFILIMVVTGVLALVSSRIIFYQEKKR